MKLRTLFTLLLSTGLLLVACAPTSTATPIGAVGATPSAAPNSDATTSGDSTTTVAGSTSDADLACSGGKASAAVTVELTEGPFYKAGSPESSTLYQAGIAGKMLTVSGYVYDTHCQAVANAWLDFWQANSNGNYDNSGYSLRGHQYTDATGHYQLTTVVPGLYPGRTEHIHFKVQAPNGKILTSQLFFPGLSQNNSDGIYDASLLLSIQETTDGLVGQYNFVVPPQN